MKAIIEEIRDFFEFLGWTVRNDKTGCGSIVVLAAFGLILFAFFFVGKAIYELLP